MSQVAETIIRVRSTAQRVGLAEFARAAGVPYTTVKSFADRGWTNKNLEVLTLLDEAAQRLSSATGVAEGGDEVSRNQQAPIPAEVAP